jgi:alpha-tubulin suppressor-like RCC1 family protein
MPSAPVLANVAYDATGEPIAALGGLHACAATADGALRCWGGRVYGGLGDGAAAVFDAPTEITALRGARDLAAGAFHTCATVGTVGEEPRVVCAGSNSVGQLGALSGGAEPTPQTVRDGATTGPALGAGRLLTAGYNHGCALAGAQTRCWGFNDQGQLGFGPPSQSPAFAALPTPTRLLDVNSLAAGGAHTCAAATDHVWCWGANASGQCGVALTLPSSPTPIRVALGTGAALAQVATGDAHTCIRTVNHTVFCWGANEAGQSGRTGTMVATPGPLVSGTWSGLDGMALGGRHSCVWANGGAVWCWGANNRGQSMPGVAVASSSSPIVVPGITGTTTVGAGAEHTCAATGTGVLCWGGNYRGQLGVGSVSWRPSDAPMPVALPRDVAVVKLVGGLQHTCALLADGRVFCWGSNHVGQLATGERFVQPTASLGGVRWR